jgi:hypothetical protein
MDAELAARLDALEKKIDAAYASAEKTRKYFLAVLVISLIAFVLPLIGLVFAIPSMLSTYSELLAM